MVLGDLGHGLDGLLDGHIVIHAVLVVQVDVVAAEPGLAISLLRLDGHANIAAANRHHARDP